MSFILLMIYIHEIRLKIKIIFMSVFGFIFYVIHTNFLNINNILILSINNYVYFYIIQVLQYSLWYFFLFILLSIIFTLIEPKTIKYSELLKPKNFNEIEKEDDLFLKIISLVQSFFVLKYTAFDSPYSGMLIIAFVLFLLFRGMGYIRNNGKYRYLSVVFFIFVIIFDIMIYFYNLIIENEYLKTISIVFNMPISFSFLVLILGLLYVIYKMLNGLFEKRYEQNLFDNTINC